MDGNLHQYKIYLYKVIYDCFILSLYYFFPVYLIVQAVDLFDTVRE